MGLFRKITNQELDKLAYKCVQVYREIRKSNLDASVWDFCPQYFKETNEDLQMDRNPLYEFLREKSVYEEGNILTDLEIKAAFQEYIGKPVRRLDYGTFFQRDDRYEIVKKVKICLHCNKEAHRKCCDQACHKDRSDRTLVKNIKLLI